MGKYNIQWDLVVLFVIFMAVLLTFDERKPSEKKAKEALKGKGRRRRTKRSGFRRMRSPAERAYARARSREQQVQG